MADAPERIWAIPSLGGDWGDGLGMWWPEDTRLDPQAEYIRADIARADADLAVAEAIRRAAEEADSFAKQSVSDAAFWRKDGMPKTAVVSEEHAKAARLVSAAILTLAPADALAEVQRLRARVTSLSEQVDTIAEQRVSALARVEKLRDAGLGLKSIVEGIQGAMEHGTWRAERSNLRMKDTDEWVTFYNVLAALDEDAK